MDIHNQNPIQPNKGTSIGVQNSQGENFIPSPNATNRLTGLQNLLKNPSSYNIGGGSKKLKYPNEKFGMSQEPLLGARVEFNITDQNADPTFRYGYDHNNSSLIDSAVRGGVQTNWDRRITDVQRVSSFLATGAGIQFLTTQAALQSQNPRPQKIYNVGHNTLASIAAAGISNVRRGGILPTFGDLNLSQEFGGQLVSLAQKIIPGIPTIKDTYLAEVGGDDLLEEEKTIDPTTKEETTTKIVKKRPRLRETNYGLGDPGAPNEKSGLSEYINLINPFKDNTISYDVKIDKTIDKVNSLQIFRNKFSTPDKNEKQSKDFVPFRFEIINHDNSAENNVIVFRAYLDSISDDYNATYNSYKYNGRGEEFYTYNKFQRKIQIGFKIAAQSRHEMRPLYQKLNYLVAQTAPNYETYSGRIRTPYCKLTVGNWFNKIPGLITNVGLSWKTDYPWEIALDRKEVEGTREGKDKEMLILPHVLDVNLSFQPIHSFAPSNNISTPFIGIDGDVNSANWISSVKDTIEGVFVPEGTSIEEVTIVEDKN